MRPKKKDPGLVELPHDLDTLVDAVKDEFSVTTRQLCCALQCSRPFVADHCRQLRHIYVSGRWGAAVGVRGGGTLWSLPDLDRMVESSTVERRTRVVAFHNFTDDPGELDWYERAEKHADALADSADSEAFLKFMENCHDHLKEIAGPAWWPAFDDRIECCRGRRDTPWVDLGEVPGDFSDLGSEWRTTAGRKGYGDTDEEWSRAYWNGGARRLTLRLPDGATRVFYAPDPHPMASVRQFLSFPLAVDLLPGEYIRDVLLAAHGGDESLPLEIEI